MRSVAFWAGVALVNLGGPLFADAMTVGFSQIGSESGWRAAETAVTRAEAAARGRRGPEIGAAVHAARTAAVAAALAAV